MATHELDELMRLEIQVNGSPLPSRKAINFVGFDVRDNPDDKCIDIAVLEEDD